ncbi:conserved hypothetical protein [Verticillium alfalfae VaMs.102]|uniref:Lipocalin-like domain-containing protein n=1 Tax=Verticillium alfalfae (strain VaMs.102 / ATCC MYA-4576 / FGSC 10136) TaxID=526221 RepID=C9S7D0_VERA1|nr:conserved hypothetical protein [Verticillium alfalfae VaMs.102]EEY15226.1 conserved hypothetical protein [Verticillium alfalfae VaMs.102]
MAAPSEKSLKDMTGQWFVATKLCEGFEQYLSLQGLPWWKRQFLHILTVKETHTQYVDSEGITHIDVALSISGGFGGNSENRIIDNKKHAVETEMLGTLYEQCRWANLDEVDDDPWLKEGWVYTNDERENGGAGPNGELHIESRGTNSSGSFSTVGLWGFIEINGARYHCRKAICRKGKEKARVLGVYGYVGPAEK